MCGKYQKGRQNVKTANSGKRTRGGGRGGRQGYGVTGWQALRGALDGMSTGCYAICWQIELQFKKRKIAEEGILKNK